MTAREFSIITCLLAATLGACGSDDPGADHGDDPGDGSGSGDPPAPLTPEGTFAITSEFDLATNAPGTAGEIARYFVAATDDPDDPTRFIVAKLIEALPDGQVKNVLEGAAPLVTGYLNDRLLEIAPGLLVKLVAAGDKLGQVTKHFGTRETLAIGATGAATKTVSGLHFTIDNVVLDFAFADHGIAETKVEGLEVALGKSGKLEVGTHTVGLDYGQVLRLAIDQAVIPMIDPSRSNLGELLTAAVSCKAVGKHVFEALDFGSPSTFESACNAGLIAAGAAFYRALDDLDGSALEFGLAGVARGVDRNRDGAMDEIVAGTWSGTLGYAGTTVPLGTAKFSGARP